MLKYGALNNAGDWEEVGERRYLISRMGVEREQVLTFTSGGARGGTVNVSVKKGNGLPQDTTGHNGDGTVGITR